MAEQQNNREEQELNHLLKVRREKLSELCESGRDPFQITKYDVTAHSMEVKENYEEMEGKEVSLAGRMMSKRVMGKASFCNLRICREISSLTLQETAWARKHIKISRNLTWVM